MEENNTFKFKVGDKVRVIYDIQRPTVETVMSVNDDAVVVVNSDGRQSTYHSDWIQKIDVSLDPVLEKKEMIDGPQHYGGKENIYEAIKVIEAWGLGFNLGNTAKYISRAGKKDPNKTIEDLKKAKFYLDREITNQEKNK